MNGNKEHLMKLLTALLLALTLLFTSNVTAADQTHVLILVTQADKMTSGKPTGLWLEEYAVPYNLFIAEGFKVTTVTLNGGKVPIDARSKPNDKQKAEWQEAIKQLQYTRVLNQVDLKKFDAIVIPGGHGVMFDLVDAKDATQAIETFNKQQKIIAAICHGPAALVNAKSPNGAPLVHNRDVTGFSDSEEAAVKLTDDMPFLLESKLRELRAKVTTTSNFQPHAVQSGNLITGQNPASSHAVAQLVIKALKR
ncbi:MAG: glutamine amidotransferase [Phycisphaeraceae bacterium]|nr:glutamine amidotransferase [Phycisphaeraceae bacterium]